MGTATPYKPARLVLTQPKEWPPASPFPRGEDGSTEGQKQCSVKGQRCFALSSIHKFYGKELQREIVKDWNKAAQVGVGKKAQFWELSPLIVISYTAMFAVHKAFVCLLSRFWRKNRQTIAAGVRGLRWSSRVPLSDWLTQGAANYSHGPAPVCG